MKSNPKALQIIVRSLSSPATTGFLQMGERRFPCALGKAGKTYLKREGDLASPKGSWQPLELFYRADRISRPRSALKTRIIRPGDGWCDAINDRNYNRHVTHPYEKSAERLWRQDHLYDIVITLNHNTVPRCQGHGSAIFIHLAQHDFSPTHGCLALQLRDLKHLASHLQPDTKIII